MSLSVSASTLSPKSVPDSIPWYERLRNTFFGRRDPPKNVDPTATKTVDPAPETVDPVPVDLEDDCMYVEDGTPEEQAHIQALKRAKHLTYLCPLNGGMRHPACVYVTGDGGKYFVTKTGKYLLQQVFFPMVMNPPPLPHDSKYDYVTDETGKAYAKADGELLLVPKSIQYAGRVGFQTPYE